MARTNTPRRHLLDALTIRDRKGKLEGWNVTILGDILHSRVARSRLFIYSQKFGTAHHSLQACHVVSARDGIAGPNLRRTPRVEEALDGADVILVLRVQTEAPARAGARPRRNISVAIR